MRIHHSPRPADAFVQAFARRAMHEFPGAELDVTVTGESPTRCAIAVAAWSGDAPGIGVLRAEEATYAERGRFGQDDVAVVVLDGAGLPLVLASMNRLLAT